MGLLGAENPLITEIQWHVKDLERIEAVMVQLLDTVSDEDYTVGIRGAVLFVKQLQMYANYKK